MTCIVKVPKGDATVLSRRRGRTPLVLIRFQRDAAVSARVAMNVASTSLLFLLFLMTMTMITVPGGFVVAFQPAIAGQSNTGTFRHLGKPATARFESQPQQQYEITPFATSRFWKPRKPFLKDVVTRSPPLSITVLRASPLPLTEKEVRNGIDKVVLALRKDSRTNQELGQLQRVTTILGSGRQQMDAILAVRFNASFQKSGSGWSSIPLPFGLGQSNVSEGRGTMVGQVKASINVKTGKVVSCSVFRDLGYGRTFDLKV